MLDEEVHLPRQLRHVEGDAVREVLRVGQLPAAPLEHVDEGHRLAVQRRVPRRGRRAEVRLQCDVAEIFEREHAEIVRVAEDARHRHRHRREQLGGVDERQRRVVERRGVGRAARTARPSRGRTRK